MPVTAIMAAEAPSPAPPVLMETVLPDAGDRDGMLCGGDALRLMGRAALDAAARHANARMVLVRVDDVRFHRPVPAGHRLELSARVIHVNAAALTILVDGMVQSAAGGRRTLALSGYFQMIAADAIETDAGGYR